jgi:hypothetical protein
MCLDYYLYRRVLKSPSVLRTPEFEHVFVGGLEADGALISGKGCFEKLQGLVASSEFDPYREKVEEMLPCCSEKHMPKALWQEICL